MVASDLCVFASNFTDPTSGELVYGRFCVADTEFQYGTEPCRCKDTWSYPELAGCDSQSGCPSASCDGDFSSLFRANVKSWCEVENAPCLSGVANPSGGSYSACVPEELPGACDCLDSWEHEGETFNGCTTTKSWPGQPWCKVGFTCTVGSARVDSNGISYAYKTCTDGVGTEVCTCKQENGADQCLDGVVPHCEVANAPCLTATSSSSTQYVPCDHPSCECLASWNFNGTTYEGCHGPANAQSFYNHWCVTSPDCLAAHEIADPTGGTVHASACEADTCPCKDVWTYNGVTHNGCGADADYAVTGLLKTWCEVEDSCASPKTLKDGTRDLKYTQCLRADACECAEEWYWWGAKQSLCATTQDQPGKPFCIVKDSDCPNLDQYIAGVGGIVSCQGDITDDAPACECATDCAEVNGVLSCEAKFTPCKTAPTPAFGGVAWISCAAPTEVPAGQPCACKSEWTWEGRSYSECQNTPSNLIAPWCIVDSMLCEYATNFTDPTSGELVYGRFCVADTEFQYGTEPCRCKDTWSYPELAGCDSQSGCPSASCDGDFSSLFRANVKSWCEVENAPCLSGVANPSGGSYSACVPEELPGACDCLDSWEHEGETFNGCTTTKSWPGQPWCKVGFTCTVGSARVDSNGISYAYKTCTDGVGTEVCTCKQENGADQCLDGVVPHCEVANAPCLTATSSSSTQYVPCDHPSCECLASWNFNGTTYEGCHGPANAQSFYNHWCVTSPDCLAAHEIADPTGGTVHASACEADTCPCKDVWTYNGVTHNGCGADADYAVTGLLKTWCEVEDSCASPKTLKDGTRDLKYTQCLRADACECAEEWYWWGAKQSLCATTQDQPGKPFCIVKDSDCPNLDQYIAGVGGIVSCQGDITDDAPACECATDCAEVNGVLSCEAKFTPCKTAPTPAFGGVAWISCAAPTEVPAGQPCACKSEWTWEGRSYSECQNTPSNLIAPWCIVDSMLCEYATNFTDPTSGELVYGRFCVADTEFQYGTEPCRCKDTWSYPELAGCDSQSGCPSASCDGDFSSLFRANVKSWCEVENAPCLSGVANPSGGSYSACVPEELPGACDCLDSWEHEGETFNGCTTTKSWPGQPWCKVGFTCTVGSARVDSNGISYAYKTCTDGVGTEVCTCKQENGADQCLDGVVPHCEVANAPCLTATSSSSTQYVPCDHPSCECLASWNFNGTTYEGCHGPANAQSFYNHWCVTSPDCLAAHEIADPTGGTVHASACEADTCPCKDVWTYNGVTHNGCGADADYAVTGLLKTWCEVEDSCASPKTLKDGTRDLKYTQCLRADACECAEEWYWWGAKQSLCATTQDQPGKPFCIVKDSDCPNLDQYIAGVGGIVSCQGDITDDAPACECATDCAEVNGVLSCEAKFTPCKTAPTPAFGGVAWISCAAPTEVPAGQPCACKSEWTWEGRSYSECQNTPSNLIAPWCIVDSMLCEYATNFTDPTSGELVYGRFCVADTEFQYGTEPCRCKDTWSYPELAGCDSQSGCPSASCDGDFSSLFRANVKSWCEVENAPCLSGVANPSGGSYSACVPEELPGACDCLDSWEHEGETFNGCTTTKSWPGQPWCKVGFTCTVGSARVDSNGISYAYKTCTDGVGTEVCTCKQENGADQCLDGVVPHCEVANAPCLTATSSSSTQYVPCDHPSCECLASWNFNGTTYEGCHGPANAQSFYNHWCVTSPDCLAAHEIADPTGGTVHASACEADTCPCKDVWTYNGVTHNGCGADADYAVTGLLKTWCEVEDSCASPKTLKDGTRDLKYTQCLRADACECAEEWYWWGAKQSLCATTQDQPGKPFCIVKDSDCPNLDQYIAGVGGIVSCQGDITDDAPACECATDCAEVNGVLSCEAKFTPCKTAPTPAFGGVAWISCAAPTEVPAGQPCACKSEWTWEGRSYSECQNTPSNLIAPWCIVDSMLCEYATNFTDPTSGELVYGRFCVADTEFQYGTEPCRCKDTWSYPELAGCDSQSGCPSASCDGDFSSLFRANVKSWCEVENAPCLSGVANPSGGSYSACVPEELPGACDCLDSWEHEGETFNGCTTTKSWPGQPWCKVGFTCTVGSARVDSNGISYAYKTCTDGVGTEVCTCKQENGADQCLDGVVPHCEVANAPCLTATSSSSTQYVPCDHPSCECLASWNFNGTTYEGCHGPANAQSFYNHWCVTSPDCLAAHEIADPTGGTVHASACEADTCPCKDVWTYNGVTHNGCGADADYAVTGLLKTWCEVEDSCASPKTLKDGTRDLKYTQCLRADACECAEEWYWWGAKQSLCATTQDQPGKPFCIVKDSDCPNLDQYIAGVGGIVSCQGDITDDAPACECATDCAEVNGVLSCEAKFTPCKTAPTPAFGGVAWISCAAPTEVPAGQPCACKSEWTWEGRSYSECQNTPSNLIAPWCIVDSMLCEYATNFTDPTSGELVYGRFCVADTEFQYGTEPCRCKDTWSYPELAGCDSQSGCPSASCDGDFSSLFRANVKSWCEVENAPCLSGVANPSGGSYSACVPEELPGACDCLDSWEHEGETFNGCTTTKSWPGQPWCKVGFTCTVGSARVDSNGISYAYKTCTDGVGTEVCTCKQENGADQCLDGVVPHCEVANAPCLTATSSSSTQYVPCDHPSCECLASWNFNGTTYEGCHGPANAQSFYNHWCVTSPDCLAAHEIADPTGGTVHASACEADTCPCKDVWTYNGVTHNGCGADADYAVTGLLKTWCEVEDSCASPKTLKDGTRDLKYTQCLRADACECAEEWYWWGAKQSLCATTQDQPGKPFCIVKDSDCPNLDQYIAGVGGIVSCQGDITDDAPACECATDCAEVNGVLSCEAKFTPCKTAPTPAFGGVAWISCAAPTEVPAGQPCACKSEWTWEGRSYSECQNTPSNLIAPWCIVDSMLCEYATNFTDPTSGELVYGRFCVADTEFQYGTEPCRCKDTWSYPELAGCDSQSGCPSASCDGDFSSLFRANVKSWCEVENAPCLSGVANPSGGSYSACVPEELPGACDCLDSWEHEGETFNGCTTTKSWPGQPWCKVGFTCTVGSARVDSNGISYAYKTCTDGVGTEVCTCKQENGADQCLDGVVPHCEVANAPCLTATSSSSTQYVPCDHPSCECLASWNFNGTTYEGCHGPANAQSFYNHWCVTSPDCLAAHEIADPTGGTVHASACEADTCPCKDVWTYNGVTHNGCGADADYAVTGLLKTWCEVEDSCASPKTLKDGTRDLKYTQCLRADACECAEEWYWWGAKQSLCATTQDQPGKPFCIVKDSDCPNLDQYIAGVGGIVSCQGDITDDAPACECATDCAEVNGVLSCEAKFTPCKTAPTPAFGGVAWISCAAPTEVPAGQPCACKSEWTWEGRSYSECQNTPSNLIAPWCIVDSMLCEYATNFTDPTSGELVYGRFCVADTEFQYGTEPCRCKDTWSYPELAGCDSQSGCPSASCDGDFSSLFRANVKSWCEVENAPCLSGVANPSGGSYSACVPEELPGACDCLDSWEHEGETFNGCTTTKSWPGQPWCKVGFTCTVGSARVDSNGISYAYKTCTDGVGTEVCTCKQENGADQCLDGVVPHCEVANAPCLTATSSSSTQYVPCDHPSCECLASWNFNGTTYEGCHGPANAQSFYNHWCVTSPDCLAAHEIADPTGGTVHASACEADTCPCKDVWTYNGVTHNGCGADADYAVTGLLKTWCEVEDSCASPKTLKDGTRDLKYTQCLRADACECAEEWYWWGAKQSLCATTQDQPGKPFCIVKDSDCPNLDQYIAGVGGIVSCQGDITDDAPACECATDCELVGGNNVCQPKFTPCKTAPSSSFGNAAWMVCPSGAADIGDTDPDGSADDDDGLSVWLLILILFLSLLCLALIAAASYLMLKSRRENQGNELCTQEAEAQLLDEQYTGNNKNIELDPLALTQGNDLDVEECTI